MEAIVDRQADVLEQVASDLDAISHQIFTMGASQEGGRKTEDRILRRTLAQLGRTRGPYIACAGNNGGCVPNCSVRYDIDRSSGFLKG